MSSTAAVAVHGAHGEYHELGFWRTYIFSEDHKMIGRQFLFVALFMMSVGGLMAMLMRLDLAWPDTQFSFLSILPQSLQNDSAITANTYNAEFTMHATIMIFFVIMPILVGCFGNFLIPLMIGARDMAFPKLNMLSFWVSAGGGVLGAGRTCSGRVDFLRAAECRPAVYRGRLGPEPLVHEPYRARGRLADG